MQLAGLRSWSWAIRIMSRKRKNTASHPLSIEATCQWMRNAFNAFLEKHFPASVVRSKGFVWFAQHSDFSSLMETAGNHVDISPLTYWLATLPKAERMQVLSEDRK